MHESDRPRRAGDRARRMEEHRRHGRDL